MPSLLLHDLIITLPVPGLLCIAFHAILLLLQVDTHANNADKTISRLQKELDELQGKSFLDCFFCSCKTQTPNFSF